MIELRSDETLRLFLIYRWETGLAYHPHRRPFCGIRSSADMQIARPRSGEQLCSDGRATGL
jgi:hypothetical protein